MEIFDPTIRESDLLAVTHKVCGSVCELMLLGIFVRRMRCIASGIGVGLEVATCDPWITSQDSDGKPVALDEGVQIVHDYEGELTLSYDDFYFYLDLCTNIYCTEYPSDKQSLIESLSLYRKNYLNDEPAETILARVKQRYHKEP